MVKQYSKIAIGNPNLKLKVGENIVNTNANFEIKNVIVFLKNNANWGEEPERGYDIKNFTRRQNLYFKDSMGYLIIPIKMAIKNKNQISITVENPSIMADLTFSQFIITN